MSDMPIIKEPRENELRPDLQSTTSLQPLAGHVSSPRLQMFNSHITQALPVEGCTSRRMFSGMESKFGDFTFSVRIPHDARVVRTIQRYPRTIGAQAIRENPETIVIYEYDKVDESGRLVKEVDYVSCPTYHELHQQFGFMYNYVEPITEYIPEDTRLAQSPSISPEGDYRYGLEAEVALMSVPQIIEDGVVASESFCKRMTTTAIEKYVISWGKNEYPLNLYGDDSVYKPHPDIGEIINNDGILLALRRYDDDTAPVLMSRKALQSPDFKYDRCFYVSPGAKVIDVRVHHDLRLRGAIRGKTLNTPVGMSEQAEKYLQAERVFYQAILNEHRRLYAAKKDDLHISPRFHRLLVEAMAATADSNKQRIVRTYRGAPIDEWRIEIVLAREVVPSIGYKLTGTHGDKGVIVDVMTDEDMPVDSQGNRAELIMDGHSTIKRMNVSRVYEQYVNACSREVTNQVRAMAEKGASVNEITKYLLPYYQTISPRMVPLVTDKQGKLRDSHIQSVLSDGVRLWIPTDNEPEMVNVIPWLAKHYPPVHGPVTYRGMSGDVVQTVKPVLIGSMYIMLLEKTGSNWAGVSSAKLSHFGIPAKLTSADRHTSPGRNQPIRFGESEGRLFVAAVGGRETAALFDRTNNPVVRRVVQETLHRVDTPTNVEQIVDRDVYPSGHSRILALIRHVGECAGWRFKRGKSVNG